MKIRNNKKGLVAALTIAGVSVGIGAGVVIAKKIKESSEEDIGENFNEYFESVQDNKDIANPDSRYKQTLFFRRDRVNKKVPKGIKGEK